MLFGIAPAPEEFQGRVDAATEGLEGVVPIFDFIIFGVGDTYDEAVEDHNRKLITFLERCRERGIKLNNTLFTRSYLYGPPHFSRWVEARGSED